MSTNARKLIRYSRFFLQATESVIFEGNGAELVGHIVWINSQGGNTVLSDGCPTSAQNLNYTLLTAITPGFIVVGKDGEDNSLITVTVRDLDMYELGSVAQIYKNASLILEDLNLERIISHEAGCKKPAIWAFEGANFTARNTVWNTIVNFAEVPAGAPAAFLGAIAGGRAGAGNLTIENSLFYRVNKSAGSIGWDGQTGSKVNIVTSRFEESEGIAVIGAATTNIVNTLWSNEIFGGIEGENRIITTSTGPMNIIASTLLYPSADCDTWL